MSMFPRYDTAGLTLAAAIIVFTLSAAPAGAELDHADLGLFVSDGRIGTGHVEEDDTIEVQRVFDWEATLFDGDWFVDLGIDSETGTFDPESAIGFNFRRPLALWLNETDGFRDLDPATEETASIERAALFTTSGEGFVSGFTWDVGASGAFHEHYDVWINNPANGNDAIYLIELEFWSTDDTLASTYRSDVGEFGVSDPIWLLVAREHTDELTKAIDYVSTTVIPEPAAGGMLAAAAGLLLMRRRPASRRPVAPQA